MNHPLIINGYSSIKDLALSFYENDCYYSLALSLINQADNDLFKGYKKLGLLGYLAGSSIYSASREQEFNKLGWGCGFMRYDALSELLLELMKIDCSDELLNAYNYLCEMWRISKQHMMCL